MDGNVRDGRCIKRAPVGLDLLISDQFHRQHSFNIFQSGTGISTVPILISDKYRS